MKVENQNIEKILRLNGVTVDLGKRVILIDGKTVRLSPTETKFLEIITRHPGYLHSRESIVEQIWGREAGSKEYQQLRTHVARIRKKLKDTSHPYSFITVENGRGYRWGLPNSSLA
jgi:two-component system KDP operon response regulator KdpE